jgi:uncharacterized protein YcnI
VSRLVIVTAVAAFVAVVATALPAWAHVEVTADKPQAGATNVTVTFSGEAESDTAGIQSEQIFLPAGITPQQVHLGKAPAGWTLTPGADNVTIAGPALPVGTDAEVSIVVDKFPSDATELVFKTLETYSDGHIDRWIELQAPGQPEPEHPAPTLKLTGAAAAPTATFQATTSPPPPPATTPGETGGIAGGVIATIVLLLLAAAVAVAYVLKRRQRAARKAEKTDDGQ